jgi:hypothetical protein
MPLSEAPLPSPAPSGAWDGFRGRLRLYLYDEAPSIGCGWRSVTIMVKGQRVRLLNHWTGDVKWVTRENFEHLAAHSLAAGHTPTLVKPVSKLLDRIEERHIPLGLTSKWKPSNQNISDDYPRLPACLDRRRGKLRLVVSNDARAPIGEVA